MKINQIISETTTAGAVAPVSQSFVKMQTRNPVVSSKKGNNLLTGKVTNKKYANSVNESKMKDLVMDLKSGPDGLTDEEFKKKYGKTKQEMRKAMKEKPEPVQKVEEAKLEEDDIIVLPGGKSKRKTGFVAKGQSRVDHEVEMARSDILATIKNAKALYKLLQHRSEDEGLEGWVQEKLIKANDYLNAVKEYYDEKMMQQEGLGKDLKRLATGKDVKSRAGQEIAKAQQASITGDNKTAHKHFKRYDKLDKLANKEQVDEKAVSKAQQRFMGMVHAVQKGEMKAPSKEVSKVAKGMSKKAGHDYASTKHKGLPEKVKK